MSSRIPRLLKWSYTTFVAALVPVYVRQYGWRNFLWFSDVALLVAVPALWLEQPRLVSMQAVSITIPEAGWSADLFAQTLFGRHVLGLADYMFDRKIPRPVRALSLFHLWLPPLLLWATARLGYDRRALRDQVRLTWALLLATYLLTEPAENVNWVFGPGGSPQRALDGRLYLLLVMALYPLAFHWPAHLMFDRLFPPPRSNAVTMEGARRAQR